MYRTYSYNDMPVPAKRKREDADAKPAVKKDDMKKKPEKPPEKPHDKQENNGILANLKNDDVILIAVALVLLTDGCDDKLLLVALAYIFISEIL